MTAADTLVAATPKPAPDAKIKRDRYKRYLIPDPATGEEKAWTRVTTLVDALDDKYGLNKWDQRNIVYGLGQRKDLYARAAAAAPEDQEDLGDIAWKAMQASKSSAGANTGTALHRFTERLDLGQITAADVPEDWRADIVAYERATIGAGILVVPGWLERVVVVPELSCAGTADRLNEADTWRLPRIGDLKSGKVEKGWLKIAMQLACYAHASHWFDPDTETLHPIDFDIDQDIAVVFHLPPESGVCTPYAVDIAFGWEAAQVAYDVREKFRKRKDIAHVIGSPAVVTPAEASGVTGGGEGAAPAVVTGAPSPPASPTPPAEVDPPASAERVAWLRARVKAIYDAGHGPDLDGRWLIDVCPVPMRDYTDAQVSHASEWCYEVEALHELSLSAPDPVFASFMEPAPAPEPTPAPEPANPLADAQMWTDKAKALLADFDKAEVVAIAEAAGMTPADSRMNERRYTCVAALVEQLSAPDGAVQFAYGQDIAFVEPSADAALRMEQACTGPDGNTLGKAAALTRAKAVAKDLGLPLPRGLAKAAESPLLAALVAAGHGAPTPNESEST